MTTARPAAKPATSAALEATDVSRAFGAVQALRDVTLRLMPGVVTALLGENGAGKSTLIRICSGEMQPDTGALSMDGHPVRFATPLEAVRAGVQVVHQEPQLVDELSIAANLFLHQLGERRATQLVHRAGQIEEAEALLRRLGMADQLPDPERPCRDLSAAERQLVDIARALSRQPKVLFLDEPNSSLTRNETDRLFEVVRRLRDDGVAVAFVSHRLAEVYEIAERVIVLRDGRLVAEGAAGDIPIDRAVRLMAGERKSAEHTALQVDRRVGGQVDVAPALELRGCSGESFHDVSFAVQPGEIVGMAGLVGAGRTETARATIGADRMLGGEVLVGGVPVRIGSPRAALRSGISYVAEERRTEIFHGQDVAYNLTVRILDRLGPLGMVSGRRRDRRSRELTDEFGIRAASTDAPITSLSGGNQQKVLLARALASHPKVLILDEPTRGVDVGTKTEMYAELRELAHERGLAIWFISSELEEVLELADRVLVMRQGRLVADHPNRGDAEEVVSAAMGAAAAQQATAGAGAATQPERTTT